MTDELPLGEGLDPVERGLLAGLPREMPFDPRLEDSTVAALAERGLLRSRNLRKGSGWMTAAAALLLFTSGSAVGYLLAERRNDTGRAPVDISSAASTTLEEAPQGNSRRTIWF